MCSTNTYTLPKITVRHITVDMGCGKTSLYELWLNDSYENTYPDKDSIMKRIRMIVDRMMD